MTIDLSFKRYSSIGNRAYNGGLADSFLFALANDELCNFYQPVFDCKTQKITRYEALVRWNHPTLGVLTPNEFLPIVKEFAFFDELFRVVMINLLKDIEIIGNGHVFSINVDVENLKHPEFSKLVFSMCKKSGVCPSRIILEVTENSNLTHCNVVLDNLTELSKKFIVSIDDFGSGYSSLEKLCVFPFTEIKIDKYLVQGVEKNTIKQKIVKNICSLASELGLELVAEGIESKATLNNLINLDIRYYQGYYFGKPKPVNLIDVI